MYALRSQYYPPQGGLPLMDEDALPRTFIHSIYKFGYCTPDVLQKVFLRKTSNVTLSDFQSTQAPYLYLLEDEGTQRFRLQCIVMKIFVPRKHLFRRSRLPMYYCQGELFLVYKLTFQRVELHEFYFRTLINMPSNFFFEFYHAPPL
ncbi:uncharacterized protein LOC113502123 [Trichoplusia ni]|uniref:Uncharacterized protein LOC113502123 n=1 Tax=Trichoplusia ni TaxID=7111 RepID=A0A7E5WF25_TRINI|nr:uncharacterized protein LOC113502123 [Trichoplusia ni]